METIRLRLAEETFPVTDNGTYAHFHTTVFGTN